MIEERSR